MSFYDRNWPGLVVVGLGIWLLYMWRNDPTLHSPSGHATIIDNYCSVEISNSRMSNQIWTDMQWCLANAKEQRKQAGLP